MIKRNKSKIICSYVYSESRKKLTLIIFPLNFEEDHKNYVSSDNYPNTLTYFFDKYLYLFEKEC